jgi:hypothetical protein
VQNNRGYAPGLAWVKYNQKLAFHHGDMIFKRTISPATPDDSVIHRRPYHDMQCNEMQGYDQLTAIVTRINTLYVSQVNELVLTMTVSRLHIHVVG